MLFGIIQNCIVGLLDGFGEQTCANRGIVQESVVLDLGSVLPKVRQEGVYRNLTGNFPCGMATHAIAYHKNAQPLVVAEIVFVRRAHPSYIAAASDFYC